MSDVLAHIALGSNLGDRGATLMEALKLLSEVEGVTVRLVSQFERTQPEGGPAEQEPYLNGAAELAVTQTPGELLAAMQEIERALGRRRQDEPRWGPRTCDLDLLLMGPTVLDTPELTIPHPRMHERLFVLRPLASIAPQAVHPVLGRTIVDLLAEAEVSQ